MEHIPAPLLTAIRQWSDPAQQAAWACRTIFQSIAADAAIGALEETLKWGQPAWLPQRPRTGSTLRMDWSRHAPDHLALFVGCKTDLAMRMRDIYPDMMQNDGRRRIAFRLDTVLPEQAISHLAQMTFTYHLKHKATAQTA